MSLLGEFFGSLFGVGYVGVKLMQESAERAQDKEDVELCRAFREKYTDSVLEAKLAAQVRDPSQYNSVWERIEEYKRTHTRRTVWFPVELIDVSSRPEILEKRMEGDPLYEKYFSFGWEDIGTKRIPLQDFYRSRNEDDHKYIDTMKWLMFTYEKLPKRNAEGTITTMNTDKDLIKHLRENRYKYGIDRESVELSDDKLVAAFRQKYTDLELEQRLMEQIKDPSKYEAIWNRIEEYRKANSRLTVWFPVELFDKFGSGPDSEKYRNTLYASKHPLFGWDDICNTRINTRDSYNGENDETLKRNRIITLRWLMFTYEKINTLTANVLFARKTSIFDDSSDYKKLVEYLRKNRDKYGI